jgi:hypothetical protein
MKYSYGLLLCALTFAAGSAMAQNVVVPPLASAGPQAYLGDWHKGPSSIGCGWDPKKPEPWEFDLNFTGYDAASYRFIGTLAVRCAFGKTEGITATLGKNATAEVISDGRVKATLLSDDGRQVLATYFLCEDGSGTFVNVRGISAEFIVEKRRSS